MGRRRSRPIRAGRAGGAALLALALGVSALGAAASEEGAGEPAASITDDTAAPVGLDALLRLPSATTPAEPAKRGGAARTEWLERFDAARAQLSDAEQRLATAQDKLVKLSANSSAWQLSAPGGQATENGPLSFELRKQIREGREEVARAQNALDELRIEANLAGVPEDWTVRAPATPAPATP